jgi:hypothetical protein
MSIRQNNHLKTPPHHTAHRTEHPIPQSHRFPGKYLLVKNGIQSQMKEDYGELLYKMPNSIHHRNLKFSLGGIVLTIIGLTLIFMMFILFLDTAWHSGFIYNGASIFAILLLICILIAVTIMLFLSFRNDLKKGFRLIRFRIYKNGFVPQEKPLNYYFINKLNFINYNDIKKLEFKSSGFLCKQTLKNGATLEIYIDSNSPKSYDIEGYIKLMKLLQSKFPKEKYPDFEVLKKYFCMIEDFVDDKISLSKWESELEKYHDINKDFR